MQNIKNIIFDLGGVFLTLDYNKTEQAFLKLGATNFRNLYTQQHASLLFGQLETGTITPDYFYKKFRKETHISATDQQIEAAWNAMLGHFPPERIVWLNNISKKYNIYLFSNTNAIHYKHFAEKFYHDTGGQDFDSHFIKAYYSHFLGLRKPDVHSYLRILQEQNINASETLFIDDTFPNIEGAQQVGLEAIYLKKPATVLELDL